MAADIGWLVLGFVGLYYGAEWLVKGASSIALLLGIKPIVVGLTIVAFGTSSPELVVCMAAVFQESQGLAVGNIIGSNIANIGLILGVAALITPLRIELSLLRRELPIMIGASVVFFLMTLDLVVSFWDGLFLFLGLLGYTGFHLYGALKITQGKQDVDIDEAGSGNAYANIFWVVIGVVLLAGGAHLMVQAGASLARAFGVSEVMIGLTLFAVGTSLPELATSIVSTLRGETDICVSNVIGSNLFNTLLIIGVVSLVAPLNVEPSLLSFELPIMLLFSFALIPLMWSGFTISRLEGGLLLGGYIAFIAYIF